MRVATKKTDVYTFSELSDSAKEKALNTCRQLETDCEWWEYTFDDCKEIGKILGIQIDNIYFSGFSSQGDGACFVGTYEYAKGSVAKIKKHLPANYTDENGKVIDCKLNMEVIDLASQLYELQRQYFYGLYCDTKHRGHYNHSGCMDVTVSNNITHDDATTNAENELINIMQLFADWIYNRLSAEYDYLTSDESVKENIDANEQEFTADGKFYY